MSENMNKTKRCPFLEGKLFGKRFEGIDTTIKEVIALHQHVKLDFRCSQNGVMFNHLATDCVENHCLDEEHTSCPHYSERMCELSLKIPLECPLSTIDNDKPYIKNCEQTHESCDEYWIDVSDSDNGDYRKCPIFSKWFWLNSAQNTEGEKK